VLQDISSGKSGEDSRNKHDQQRTEMNKAAQQLGRLAAGKPKKFSQSELDRRKKRLALGRQKLAEMRKAKK
jgi:hypothetical protein